MESSKIIDVQYVSHQKQLRIVRKGKNEYISPIMIRQYSQVEVNQDVQVVGPQKLDYMDVNLDTIIGKKACRTYLNLQFTSPLKPRELLNKYTVENNLNFASPSDQDLSVISYYIHIDPVSEKVVFVICRIKDKEQMFVDETFFSGISKVDFMKNQPNIYLGDEYQICRKFVDFIQSISGIRILVGFKMSLGKHCKVAKVIENAIGYQVSKLFKFGVPTQDSKCDQQLKYIEQFQNVYFLDSFILIFESLSRQEKSSIAGSQQQDYINLLFPDIEIKDNELSTQLISLASLQETICSRCLIQRKLNMMDLLNISLSFTLYETPVTCIQQYLMREFFKKDYLFVYECFEKTDKSLEQSYKGALIEQVGPEMRFKIISNICEGDYFSLYPTCIAAYNISHETVVNTEYSESETKKIQINYQSQFSSDPIEEITNPEYQQFRQDIVGVVPQLVMRLLELRKVTVDPVENGNLKLILASIYGILGFKSSPFYNLFCATSICALGRKACDIAREEIHGLTQFNKIICRNTDSVSFQLKTKFNDKVSAKVHYADLTQEWILLNQRIQTRLGSELFQFKFESKKFQLYTMFSNQKKAYISIQCDFDYFMNQSEESLRSDQLVGLLYQKCGVSLEVKGPFAWTNYSQSKVQANRRLFLSILSSNTVHKQQSAEETIKFVTKQIMKHEDDVQTDVLRHLHSGLTSNLREYAQFLKYSPDDERCVFLMETYRKQGSCQILPYTDESPENAKMASRNIIPFEFINKDNCHRVQQNKIVKEYYNPVRLFFGIKNQQSEQIAIPKYFLDKNAILNDNECIIRIERSCINVFGQVKKQYEYETMGFHDIEYTVSKNQGVSFHEMIQRPFNKMYFDVETEHKIQFHQLLRCITNGVKKIAQSHKGKIHVVSAHKEDKTSYHVIVDIACDILTNKFIAQQMEHTLRKLMELPVMFKEDDRIFDLKVYKTSNASMRLPACVKIDKVGKVEKRPFQIESIGSQFIDFIINRTTDCTLKLDKCILFDNICPLFVSRPNLKFSLQEIQQVQNQICELTGNQSWKHTEFEGKSFVSFGCATQYKCPICKRQHSSDNMFITKENKHTITLNCFSNKQRQQGTAPAIRIQLGEAQLEEKVDKSAQLKHILQQTQIDDFSDIATRTVKERYIKFQIDSATSFVISDMGTAKSTCVEKFLESETKKSKGKSTILCLSFRRVYSIEFARRYNLQNYMDVPGPLSPQITPKLILQMDSLHRYDTSNCPKYLIIDEVESILEKILSCSDYTHVIHKFITLLQNCEKVIIMDGLMERQTITYINILRKTDSFNVIYNLETPREDYRQILYKFTAHDIQYVADMILSKVNNGKNVYGMITSKSLGKFVKDYLQSKGVKCIFYHGDDSNIETDSSDQQDCHKYTTQLFLKSEHFKDVNTYWQKYQVVLHNSAITAGISFDPKDAKDTPITHFHSQINVFSAGTCSSLSFFQGSHRVRHLVEKEIVTFVEETYENTLYTPQQFTDLQYQLDRDYDVEVNIDLSLDKQLETWLLARQGAALKFRTNLLIKYMKKMNYKIDIQEQPDHVKVTQKTDTQLFELMTSVQLNQNDTSLFDTEYLENQLSSMLCCQDESVFEVNARINKLQLKYKYKLSFDQINSLDYDIIKQIYKDRFRQDLRNQICNLLQVKDPQLLQPNWLEKHQTMYKMTRMTGGFSADTMLLYSFTQMLSSLVNEVRNKPMAYLEDIKSRVIEDARIQSFKKTLRITRKSKTEKLFQSLFSIAYLKLSTDKNNNIVISVLDIKREELNITEDLMDKTDQ